MNQINMTPLEQSCRLVVRGMRDIVGGRVKRITDRLQSNIEQAVTMHFDDVERLVTDKSDPIYDHIETVHFLLSQNSGDSIVSREGTSNIYTPKNPEGKIMREIRFRHKSTLSDLVKAGIVHITGRTHKTLDRTGLKIVLANPSSPVVDFIGDWESKNRERVVGQISEWDAANQKGLEESLGDYLSLTWRKQLSEVDKVLRGQFVQDYVTTYISKGHRVPSRRAKGLIQKFTAAKYFSRLLEIAPQLAENIDEARELFAHSIPKSDSNIKRKEHFKVVRDMMHTKYSERITSGLMVNYRNFVNRMTFGKTEERFKQKFKIENGLDTTDKVKVRYDAELILLPFARTREKQFSLFEDVFIPKYKRYFETNDLDEAKAVTGLFLDRESQWFGNQVEIGPRRLLYEKGIDTTDRRVVATAQNVFFNDAEKNYSVIIQKWSNVKAHRRFETNKVRRVVTSEVDHQFSPLSTEVVAKLREIGFEGYRYLENGIRVYSLRNGEVSVDISQTNQNNLSEELWEEQVIHYVRAVSENMKEEGDSKTGVNVSPEEMGISVMDLPMSPAQRPKGAFSDYTEFPLEKIIGTGLREDPESMAHYCKNNVNFPKKGTGYQAYKMVSEGVEIIVVTPRMQWDQSYGKSAHAGAYKGELIEDLIDDALALYGGEGSPGEMRELLQEYYETLELEVAKQYVSRIGKHVQVLCDPKSLQEDKVRSLELGIELYNRLNSEFKDRDGKDGIFRFRLEGTPTKDSVRGLLKGIPTYLGNAGSEVGLIDYAKERLKELRL